MTKQTIIAYVEDYIANGAADIEDYDIDAIADEIAALGIEDMDEMDADDFIDIIAKHDISNN